MINRGIKIKLSIFTIFICSILKVECQQIIHWEGSNTVSKFKCAKSLDILGRLVEYNYYLGVSKTDTLILNGETYHALIWGKHTNSIVGYIRRECNLVFILDKDRTAESPLFILTTLNPAISINLPFLLGGTLGGIKSIVQDTSWQVTNNGDIIQYYRFRLNNPTPPADAVIITKVTISNAGIHSFTIRPSIGPEVPCNCESSGKN
jgi:hypothetical protein